MRLNHFDRIILVGLIFASSVNILSSHIYENYPTLESIVFFFFIFLISIWLTYFILKTIINYLTSGMYAVEAFILDANNNLLIINHPFHEKLIPPGGRISRFEFPNEGLVKRLEERIGLKSSDYIFHPSFHEVFNQSIVGKAEKVPSPYIVQKEKRKQRKFVKFHYDFIYVLQLKNPNVVFKDNEYSPRWVDYHILKEIHRRGETFPDVIETYKQILTKCKGNG